MFNEIISKKLLKKITYDKIDNCNSVNGNKNYKSLVDVLKMFAQWSMIKSDH